MVFGPESSGLSNEEQALCHAVLTIPSHPAQPSLNLAQAVLVVAYELFMASQGSAPALPAGLSLGDPPTYFDFSTTATFTGQIEVCNERPLDHIEPARV